MLKFIVGSDDLENANLQLGAYNYLINAGMTEENINILINKLSK